MTLSHRYLRLRLRDAGLLPTSKVARVAWYLLGLDVLLFVLQSCLGWFIFLTATVLAAGSVS